MISFAIFFVVSSATRSVYLSIEEEEEVDNDGKGMNLSIHIYDCRYTVRKRERERETKRKRERERERERDDIVQHRGKQGRCSSGATFLRTSNLPSSVVLFYGNYHQNQQMISI